MVEVTTDFECGNGKNIQQLGEKHFRMQVDGDKPDGYCVYFCFDVVNRGPAIEVTVELCEDSKFGRPTAFDDYFPTTVWIKPMDFHRFRPLHERELVQGDRRVTILLPLKENERLRVAMTYVAPYTEVTEGLMNLSRERQDRCQLVSLGTSHQGREILGLRAGTPGAPKILCVAGQHPHEHAGVWGVLGIADFMSSALPEAESLRTRLDVHAIPMVNPDGNALGRNAFNAQGLDMYLAFGDDPNAAEPEAHESRLLWHWALNEAPELWMNFHCYTGWRLNSEFPYEGWYEIEDRAVFGDSDRRRIYEALCDTLRLRTDAPSTHERASIHPHSTLCHQLAQRYNIPHVFYEFNNATSGRHRAMRRAIDVFERTTQTLLFCLGM